MKEIILRIVAATLLLAPTPAGALDVIYGVWVREGHPEDKLEFYDCSGKLCAKGIEPMPDGSPAPEILRSAVKTAPNKWKGDLFNPEDGKTYKGEITLETATQMSLSGCLVAFLCQSETWTKVSGPPAKPKAVEQKPGDAKPADAKPGDGKGAEGKGAEGKSGDAKPASGRDAAKPAAHEPAKASGQEPAKAAAPAKPKPTPAKPKAAPAN